MAQNNYQKMAAAFMDMWQEQLTRTMTDRDFIHTMLDTMRRMQGAQGAAFRDETDEQTHRYAADASGPGADELDDLRRRLADCERRLARLESKPASKAKPAAKSGAGSQRRSSGGAPAKTEAKTEAKPAAKSGSQSKAKPKTKPPATKQSATRTRRAGSTQQRGTAAATTRARKKPVKRAVKRND